MLSIHLKNGKDKPIRMGHPWVFSGAVSRVEGRGEPGDLCSVVSSSGEVMGTGFYNHNSAIRVRMLAGKAEQFNQDVLSQRLAAAVARRAAILDNATDSCRLVNSEGDRLPGLIVDKYSAGLCVQIQTAGMERFRQPVIESLKRSCSPAFIYERSDPDARLREGLSGRDGVLYGDMPSEIIVQENGLKFRADIASGQKTGFFLDQRENRRLFREYARDKTICDCFCYSGGFSVYGLSGGAHSSVLVDVSDDALASARANCGINKLESLACETIKADVFDWLRKTDRFFGCLVLDPPKFAKHKGEVEAAARGYKDINLLAIKRAAAGGIIFTFSCSNAVDPTLFRQIVFAAAADSGRFVQVLHVLSAGPDHPFNIAHREGEYLKGLVLRVM
jgi:23S rRNA (cytosine1962-C5)-methyltransferase